MVSLVTTFAAYASLPHIITILQDDLGYYDSGVHSPYAATFTHNITALAQEGITLTNHYTHWHCSPSRRSFLSGRLPIHHGEQLSGDDSDDIDLRSTWISSKLASAGYQGHWFGKWHTGFRSMNHLAERNGFKTSIGSFQTGGAYSGPKHTMRWEGDHPIWDDAQWTSAPPAGCGSDLHPNDARRFDAQRGSGAATCDASQWHNNTEMQCSSGAPSTFPAGVSSPAECCAACVADEACTHWVFASSSADKPCHVKYGKTCPGSAKPGSTAGLAPGPAPGPAPSPSPGPAQCTNSYSTNLWGSLALQTVAEHNISKAEAPLYMHLCFQAVHTPYDRAPGGPSSLTTYQNMLWDADVWIGSIVATLKARGMWENTFIVYSSDNGGVEDGINWPLRGEKHSNWEGGLRTAAFVSGGLVPSQLRGTTNGVNMHIVDW